MPIRDKISCHFTAFLPFEVQPEAIRIRRVLEIEERQKQYIWGRPPPGIVDLPGFINASKHGDLPRDSQLSVEALSEFGRSALKGHINLGIAYLRTVFDSWQNFDSFKKLFMGLTGREVPRLSQDNLWMDDRVFGYQFLNGCNPCVIERCDELPKNFPVTNDMVKDFLDRGMDLEKEIKVNCK